MDHTLGRPALHLTRSAAAWGFAAVACGPGSLAEPTPTPAAVLERDPATAPAGSANPSEIGDESDGATAFHAAALDAAIADRFPSIAYYPAVTTSLQDALQRGDSPVEILTALGATMAPYRWPSATDWDRSGFIDFDAVTPGFVTRTWGKSVSQPEGRNDLGCAGGFLEGVRLLLAPRLGVEVLERCDVDTFATEGAPKRCDQSKDFGWLALANIAAVLPEDRLANGRRLVELAPDDDDDRARLAVGGALHLCTVSHQAAARQRERFHHHMMIVLGGADGLDVFDTTGVRGVAIETMSDERFVRYCTTLLGSNRDFRYVPRSARLTCLAVR